MAASARRVRCRRAARRLYSLSENGEDFFESIRFDLDSLMDDDDAILGALDGVQAAIVRVRRCRDEVSTERAFGWRREGWRGINRIVALGSAVLDRLVELRAALEEGHAERARQVASLAIDLLDAGWRRAG